jgi:hypothetical protein
MSLGVPKSLVVMDEDEDREDANDDEKDDGSGGEEPELRGLLFEVGEAGFECVGGEA